VSQISAAAVASASQATEGKVELATQAEMEAGTDTGRVAAVGVLKHLRLVAKAWVKFNPVGTIQVDEGVDSITDHGVGDWTVNYTTAFSSVNYVVSATSHSAAVFQRELHTFAFAVASTRINCTNTSDVASDNTNTMAVAFGDQ